jgi:hypothetical protein
MRGHQFSVLVNHADAFIDGVERRPEFDLFATDIDLSLVRLVLAKKDFHQSGLPSAVFPQDGVDFAGFDLEIYAIVGDNSRESFGDPSRLQDCITALDISGEHFLSSPLFLVIPKKNFRSSVPRSPACPQQSSTTTDYCQA